MSDRLDKHRMRNKYPDDVFYGDEDKSGDKGSYGPLALSAVSELIKTGGQAWQEKDAKDKAAAKEKADKEAYDKAHADEKAASDVADKARKDAYDAGVTARAEMAKADAEESNPNGPKHQAAKKFQQVAALKAADAKAADERLAYYRASSLPATPEQMKALKEKHGGSSGMPTWAWWILGGLGAVGVGAFGYKLLKR